MSHNLSGDKIVLDLDQLISGAATAVYSTKWLVEKYLGETQLPAPIPGTPDEVYHSNHHRAFYAKELAKAAQDYAQAWDNYHTLVQCRDRRDRSDDFKIIIAE